MGGCQTSHSVGIPQFIVFRNGFLRADANIVDASANCKVGCMGNAYTNQALKGPIVNCSIYNGPSMNRVLLSLLLPIYLSNFCWSQQVTAPPSAEKATTSNDAFKAEVQAFLENTENVAVESASTEQDNSDSLAEPANETQFLRMQSVDGQPKSLDTAVVTYSATIQGGIQVDLIGAVHVGEAQYYAALNELFDSYDVLLYELVAPEGTVIPLGGERRDQGFNPVAMLQDGTKNMLGLESQLEKIDYTKPHFVRADMSPAQIADKMAERGDNAFTLALDTLADVMRQQNLAAENLKTQGSGAGELFLMDEEITLADMLGNPLKMKQVMAQQFANTGSLDMAMGESLNQLLIVDRNAEALRGLQKQIAAGKKKIGIFYGAAHLPDMERRLIEDFGLVKSKHSWLEAWDLTSAKATQLSEPANLLMNVLKILE